MQKMQLLIEDKAACVYIYIYIHIYEVLLHLEVKYQEHCNPCVSSVRIGHLNYQMNSWMVFWDERLLSCLMFLALRNSTLMTLYGSPSNWHVSVLSCISSIYEKLSGTQTTDIGSYFRAYFYLEAYFVMVWDWRLFCCGFVCWHFHFEYRPISPDVSWYSSCHWFDIWIT